MSARIEPADTSRLFLPDLCGMRAVFTVVIAAELLAIVLTLSPGARSLDAWRSLALTSLFVQWVALTSIASLCALRRPLARFGDRWTATASFAVIVAITAIVSEVAYRWFLPQIHANAAAHWVFDVQQDGLGRANPLGSAPATHLEFLLCSIGIAAIVGAVVLRYFYVQHQWKMRVESENEARIQALQSRIRPHFLFNSMNTIASLTRSAPELAEQVTEDLASLFRMSLGDARVSSSADEEFELCRQYLRIESLRLGERLRARIDPGDVPPDAALPALTLQPLVENAVYHGVEPAADGGDIHVHGTYEDGRVTLCIDNTRPRYAGSVTRKGNRMALDNVRQRLDAFFDGDFRLDVTREPERFVIRMRFPYRSDTD